MREEPRIGEELTDVDGRVLTVGEVVPGDPQGREVRGTIAYPDDPVDHLYSCTLVHWAHRWRDRGPNVPPEQWTSR